MKNWQKNAVLVGGALTATGINALAAVPAAYTTAIEGAIADAETMATSTLVLLVGLAVVILLGGLAIKWVKGSRRAT